jgi:hypothetical protein
MLASALLALVGCGSASTPAEKAAEAHFVALANAICREAGTTEATRASVLAGRKTELARAHALLNSARNQPAVRTYILDLAAQKRLRSTMSKGSGAFFNRSDTHSHGPRIFSELEDAYRLSVKIRADAKALGMTACIGHAPRAPIGG